MVKSVILIDANNFYASCEQAIDPSLKGKPIIVLSNNDGCIIARSAEARQLGIKMGTPYFKVKKKLEYLRVNVRSPNYELYGDISKRMMMILKNNCEELEIYSIDEAFAILTNSNSINLHRWAQDLRALIHQNLGLTITIGIGKTKVLAKIANHLAKKMDKNAGILDLSTNINNDDYLDEVEVKNVWGIGQSAQRWCYLRGINNARQLRDTPQNELKLKLGIAGIRLKLELQGIQCIPLDTSYKERKEICISRSFSREIDDLEELRQAIILYIKIASEKLRKQKLITSCITVFTNTSKYKKPFYSNKATVRLETPTNNPKILINETIYITKQIYKPSKSLIKAGVIMRKLESQAFQQQNIFKQTISKEKQKEERLVKTIDNVNKIYGKDSLQWAINSSLGNWKMKRKNISSITTTNINKSPIAWS